MKTILYNPIFINPQAYYVFPRLTRYLQPDNESTAEPANYIGTIEVKVIAYGDTTLKRTYTNTDSIDLSEFKNTWVRISLFTMAILAFKDIRIMTVIILVILALSLGTGQSSPTRYLLPTKSTK